MADEDLRPKRGEIRRLDRQYRQLRGELDRVQAERHAREAREDVLPDILDDLRYDRYLSVGTRDWKLGPPMRKPAFPEAMPDLRHNLMDGWAKWWPSPLESAPSITSLQHSELWWVGPEMCDLLYATMADIPPEVEVSHLKVPSRFGLVFLSNEWKGIIDAQTGKPGGNVDAIVWSDDVRMIENPDVTSLCVASYRYVDFDAGFTDWDFTLAQGMGLLNDKERLAQMGAPMKLRKLPKGKAQHLGPEDDPRHAIDGLDLKDEIFPALTGGIWVPLGRSDWPHGWRLDSPSSRTALGPKVGGETFDLSAQEDRRFLAALFTLLDTASLATVEERKPSRQVVRQAQRRKETPPSPVKVVFLRRPKTVRKPGEPEVEHHYSHRFRVRAHPRMQAYGPGRSLRRLIMVPAHIKGPQDAPFVAKEEVKAWVR